MLFDEEADLSWQSVIAVINCIFFSVKLSVLIPSVLCAAICCSLPVVH
jgi:hypothetical protein